MAEPSDPEVLHARLSVVEEASKRHEGEIKELKDEVQGLKICASCLPDIREDLKNIAAKVEHLTQCALRGEGQRFAYLSIREWFIVSTALASLILTNFK